MVTSAWSICRDAALAEELAQEAFVKAYRRWSKLEGGGYAEPWVHRVVMNQALSAVRRRARGGELERRAASREQPRVASPVGFDEELADALRQLPRRQREAVFLRVVADLAEDEVAAVMGCSTGSVKTHKSRGLARLRELLGDREEVDRGTGTATEAAQG